MNNHDPRLEATLFRVLYQSDFRAFVEAAFPLVYPGQVMTPSWHIDCLAWHAMLAVAAGDTNIVNLPPRSLKSCIFSVCLPAWILGNDPRKEVLCVSYSDALAHEFSIACRRLMETPFFHRNFPACRLDPRQSNRAVFKTTRNGSRRAVSIEGGVTGFGCDIMIIDDPMKSGDTDSAATRKRVIQLFSSVLSSRFNRPNERCLILVQQRQHEDDLTGYLVKLTGTCPLVMPMLATEARSYETGPGTTYRRPAGELLQPDRMDLAAYEEECKHLGSHIAAAQLQQNPLPDAGNIVKKHWFGSWTEPADYKSMLITVDPAAKTEQHNDRTAICVWGVVNPRRLDLVSAMAERLEYPALLAKVLELARGWNIRTVCIEDSSNGTALIQELKAHSQLDVLPAGTLGSKQDRFNRFAPMIECGKVWLPHQESWLADYLRELTGFPNARHDDYVDATVIALDWWSRQTYYGDAMPWGNFRLSPWMNNDDD